MFTTSIDNAPFTCEPRVTKRCNFLIAAGLIAPGGPTRRRKRDKNEKQARRFPAKRLFFFYMSYLLRICAGVFRRRENTGSMPVTVFTRKIKIMLKGGICQGK